MASELEVFILVAESGGFAGAARRLRLTPSAVSRRIAQLEDRVGTLLLARTTRKVELTAAGEAFFQRIRPLRQEIDAATRSLERFSPVPAGQLRISAPAALLEQNWFLDILFKYLARFPNLRLEATPADHGLVEGCDFVIQSFASTDKNKISRQLAANPWIVCAAPAYLEKYGTPSDPKDLLQHNCLVVGAHAHWRFKLGHSELTLAMPARFVSFGGAIHRAAVSGHGIARLAAFLVNDDLKSGHLIKLLHDYPDPSDRHLYLVFDDEKKSLPKYADFAEFLRAEFQGRF
jgi:DNA-binding transcriptional LysR family regulator